METFLILCLLAILIVGWISLRTRLAEMDSRIAGLSTEIEGHKRELVALKKASFQAVETAKAEAIGPDRPGLTREPAAPAPRAASAAAPSFMPVSGSSTVVPSRSSQEWEALLGGNWLNKAGVLVLVVGIALALGYSFTRLGPWGRVSISLIASLTLLAGGRMLEPREPYRIFARGLLGGGWAALYVTVFAMHAVDAARVIPSSIAGGILLLAVAVGMIVHSLRYRSETVTGVAYFVGFATLAITQVGASRFWPWSR